MNEPLVVAVDCSTTAAKAVISTADGQVVAAASRPLLTVQPQASWHEQDAAAWWTATRDAIAAAVGMLDEPGRVAALCLTHQRETFVCLGADDQPLRPAILWLDGRAHAEIAEHGSARVHELSGKPGDTTPAIYKLAWLARHEPETLRGAARVGDVQAVLSLRLTGRWATSPASADTLGLFDLPRRAWSDELLDIAGVRAEQLPDLVPAGEAIGMLLPDVAADLGLPAPVPLVSGIGDGQAAGLALGASAPGIAYLNLGTSMVLGVASDGYRWDPAFRTLAGVGPHDHTLETVLNAAAYVATWCREQLAGDADLEQAAAALPPGAEGLLTLPYWNAAQTPYWDPLARGAVIGWHGRHTAAHLYRSILEGVAYELRLHLERLEAATGTPVTQIRAVGGGARSPLWVRIVSDVTQRPVRVCSAGEASAAGAAALAWSHLTGMTPQQAAAQAAGPLLDGHDVHPDPTTAARHSALYDVQQRLYPQLREVFSALADARDVPLG